MAINLSEERISEFRAAFELFDKDRDGLIKTKELGSILRNLGQYPSESELNTLIKEVDMDGSGTIEFKEFLCLMIRKMKDSDPEKEFMEAFKAFDRDGNGFISEMELRLIMNNLGEKVSSEEIELMIKEVDNNYDGQIDFKEFVKMMSK